MNADQPTLESSKYHGVSDTTDAYPAEESQTSGESFATTSFLTHAKEPKPSKDELAATSLCYPFDPRSRILISSLIIATSQTSWRNRRRRRMS